MSRSKKIWLGIFTFLPVICFGLYIIIFFSFFLQISHDEIPDDPGTIPANFRIMILLILLGIISGFVMMIYYIIDVNKSSMKRDNKLIWILILVLASGIGNIAYYLVEIIGVRKTLGS